MLCEIVCALVSATLLAACWVPCCLVMCGCAEPQISGKPIQIPFFYFSTSPFNPQSPTPPNAQQQQQQQQESFNGSFQQDLPCEGEIEQITTYAMENGNQMHPTSRKTTRTYRR